MPTAKKRIHITVGDDVYKALERPYRAPMGHQGKARNRKQSRDFC